MKHVIISVLIALFFSFFGCSDVSPDAVELQVDFTWDGMIPCALGGNPEIRVSVVPAETKDLIVTLYDHDGMGHSKQTLSYDGSGIIKRGVLDAIESPCPFFDSARYTFKVEAVNENGIAIGIGSRERSFPEEN